MKTRTKNFIASLLLIPFVIIYNTAYADPQPQFHIQVNNNTRDIISLAYDIAPCSQSKVSVSPTSIGQRSVSQLTAIIDGECLQGGQTFSLCLRSSLYSNCVSGSNVIFNCQVSLAGTTAVLNSCVPGSDQMYQYSVVKNDNQTVTLTINYHIEKSKN